jgi:phosphorylcholine metabolism protein LicD
MRLPDSFFEEEVIDGFYISPITKRCLGASYEVLSEFSEICKENDIRWFSHYGTLLGAIRHGGFIPWDDDIDVCMLREDYKKLEKVMHEDSHGLVLMSVAADSETEDYANYCARIVNKYGLLSQKEELDRFYNCLFLAGIDIFIMDTISTDVGFEKKRTDLADAIHTFIAAYRFDVDQKNYEEGIEGLEELFDTKFDRKERLDRQLYRIQGNLFSECPPGTESNQVMFLNSYYGIGTKLVKDTYNIHSFDHYKEISFHGLPVRVAKNYHQMLTGEYGNFSLYIRGGAAHDYPFFEHQLAAFKNVPYEYRYPENVTPKAFTNPKEKIRGLLIKLTDYWNLSKPEIGITIDASQFISFLGSFQQIIISIGNMIETCRKENHPAVKAVEKFCEDIFQCYSYFQTLDVQGDAYAVMLEDASQKKISSFTEAFHQVTNVIEKEYLNRNEIVIIPYRAKYWYAIKDIYEKYRSDPMTDIYVIPTELHHKDAIGKFVDSIYEGNQYPENVVITDYHSYSVEKHLPDKIYIQNAYDEWNPVISTDIDYYSRVLRDFTKELIYIPWFFMEDADLKDEYGKKAVQFAAFLPGVIYADKIYVQSEALRERYVAGLTDFVVKAKENCLNKKDNEATESEGTEDTLKGLLKSDTNTPKILLSETEKLVIQESWQKKISAEYFPLKNYVDSFKNAATETTSKKAYYFISAAAVIYEGSKYFERLKLEIRKLCKEGYNITLATDQRAEEILTILDGPLLQGLKNTLKDISLRKQVTLVQEPESVDEKANVIANEDYYFGDYGNLTWLFKVYGKPVEINTVDYNKQ